MNERLADPPHVSAIRPFRPMRAVLNPPLSFEQACAHVMTFSEWKGMTIGEIGNYHRGLAFLRWLAGKLKRQCDLIGAPTPSANDREMRRILACYLVHPSIVARKPVRVPKSKG